MPILEDGTRVDMICDILGVGNRENSGQLDEVELNFNKHEMIKQMKDFDTLEEKENHFFKFIDIVNEKFHDDVASFYDKLSLEDRETFIEDIETNGFAVRQPPMYDNMNLDKFDQICEEFGIEPVNAYVNKFGRRIKLMSKVVVGDKYIYKLKHHPKGKFSSRSTSFINSKDQPAKSATTKQNKSIYQTTPLKMGNMETTNLLLNNDPGALIKMNFQYSSSIKARRNLHQLYDGPLNIQEIEMPMDATNRNAESNNIYFKALGVRINTGENIYN
jgi:DNA-directed RNA polymerase, beta subunit/140 kD subunit